MVVRNQLNVTLSVPTPLLPVLFVLKELVVDSVLFLRSGVGRLYPARHGSIQAGGQITVDSPPLNSNGRLLVFAVYNRDNYTQQLLKVQGTVTLDNDIITFRSWNNVHLCCNTITYTNASDAVVELANVGGRCGITMIDIGTSTPIITGNTANASNHTPVNGSGMIHWVASSGSNDGAGAGLSVKTGSALLCYGQETYQGANRSGYVIARYENAVDAQFTVSQSHSMVIVPD